MQANRKNRCAKSCIISAPVAMLYRNRAWHYQSQWDVRFQLHRFKSLMKQFCLPRFAYRHTAVGSICWLYKIATQWLNTHVQPYRCGLTNCKILKINLRLAMFAVKQGISMLTFFGRSHLCRKCVTQKRRPCQLGIRQFESPLHNPKTNFIGILPPPWQLDIINNIITSAIS